MNLPKIAAWGAALIAALAFFTNPGNDLLEQLRSANRSIIFGQGQSLSNRAIAAAVSVRAEDKLFFTIYTFSLPIAGDIGVCYGAFNTLVSCREFRAVQR